MPARKCPVCGRGMFRPKALWHHLLEHHKDYAIRFLGYSRQSGEEIRRRTERKKKKRAKKR